MQCFIKPGYSQSCSLKSKSYTLSIAIALQQLWKKSPTLNFHCWQLEGNSKRTNKSAHNTTGPCTPHPHTPTHTYTHLHTPTHTHIQWVRERELHSCCVLCNRRRRVVTDWDQLITIRFAFPPLLTRTTGLTNRHISPPKPGPPPPPPPAPPLLPPFKHSHTLTHPRTHYRNPSNHLPFPLTDGICILTV